MQLKAVIRCTTGCKFYQLPSEKENAAIADNIYKGMWRWSGNTLFWQVTSIICQSLDGSHPRNCNGKKTNSDIERTSTRRPMDYQDDHGEGWVGLRKQSMIEKIKGYAHDDRSWSPIITFPQFKFTKLVQKFKLTKFLLIPVSLAMILQNLT